MGFFTALERRVREVNSLLCVGLDPHPADLAEPTAQAARDFCLRLVQATWERVAAFKPNAAFFEAFGPAGYQALQEVIAVIPPGIPVILDAKRGDIASTAQAYARSAFQVLGAGAITASPYLGQDSLQPLLEDAQRGVFLLCKTSNPGAADLQDLRVLSPGLDHQVLHLFEQVALLARQWNRQDNLGLVVGATHPQALARVRALAPEMWILAPGVGAQGAELRAALAAGLRADGLGLLLPVSRAVSRAADPLQAVDLLNEEINRVRVNLVQDHQREALIASGLDAAALPIPAPLAQLADDLLAAGCVKFGQFTLKSGLSSPVYIDLRQLVSTPRLLSQVAAAYLPVLGSLRFERLAALPYAAIPIATAISLQTGWPLIYPRKEAKPYGTQAEIEGSYHPDEQVVIIDDLTTTGGSKFEAIEKLVHAGLQVRDVVVLIDRQSGASQSLAQAGFALHPVFTLTQMLTHWERHSLVSADNIQATRRFLGMADNLQK